MNRMMRCGTVVAAATLTLTACGSSTAKVDPRKDLETAKAAALTAADLPGYSTTPYSPSGDIPAPLKKQFEDCTHEPSSVFDDTPGAQIAHSPDFKKQQTDISGQVEIDPKLSDIDKGWGEISKPGVEPCLAQLFAAAVKAGVADATVKRATAARFTVGVGNRSVGYAIRVTADASGVTVDVYVDFLLVARDRAGIELDAENLGRPVDRSTEIRLVRTMNDRVGAKAQ